MNGLPWQDYKIGEIVKYKQNYYTAKFNLTGSANFDSKGFVLLDDKSEQQLSTWIIKQGNFQTFMI